MTAEENVRAQFLALLQQGSLPRSSLSGGFLRSLRPLIDSGVVVEERSGAGRRIAVRDPLALQTFLNSRFPQAPTAHITDPDTSPRLQGVAQFRDSKVLGADTVEWVIVRAWPPPALFLADQPVDAATATQRHGVFAFVLDSERNYSLRGPCALIENPTVFHRVEQLRLPIRLALYGHGRASNRLLDWLAGMTAPDFQLVHLPDYDPAGLNEFARLRDRLGSRVRLHLPDDLPARFQRFANRALLDPAASRALLANLRGHPSPDIRQVLDLIHRHNAGLEQEALFLA